MKKRSILSRIALLLAMLMLLPAVSGCAQVTQKLDQMFPEESEAVTTEDPATANMPERERRTYVVLVALRASSFESITTLSLLTFHTEDKSVHWLQLPANLFVNVSGNTVDGTFSAVYQEEIRKEGVSELKATTAAMQSICDLLEKGFNIPIDYYVSFDPDQLASFIGTLQGVPITLDKPLGGVGVGEATLNAKSVRDYLVHTAQSGSAEEGREARRVFAAALWRQASGVITPENLTLYVAQLRSQLTTNIPYAGGEDIFFWRRFLQASPEAFSITNLSAQSIYYNNTPCQVLNKSNTVRQLNEQMRVYQDALTAEQFDAQSLFVDAANPMIHTVYTSTSPFPELFTMQELDPDYQPEESVPESTEDTAEAEE